MRNNTPTLGKRNPLSSKHFVEFQEGFGVKSDGGARRRDEGENGRFRRFSRGSIDARGNNLDIFWLRDQDMGLDTELAQPDLIAAEILDNLRTAVKEMETVLVTLSR